MTIQARPSGQPGELGRDAGDRALGERPDLGRQRPLRVALDDVALDGQGDEPGLVLDDGVRVIELEAGRADDEGLVGGEAQDRRPGRQRGREGVDGGGVRDDAVTAERLRRGHGGPPGRRTGSA